MGKLKATFLPFLSLFTSLSTIFCCALPIMLVTLGMGATFASLSANIPAITWLGERSGMIFLWAIGMLTFSGYFIFIKAQSCPTDPQLAKACATSKKISKWVWIFSASTLLMSLFFKYVLIFLV